MSGEVIDTTDGRDAIHEWFSLSYANYLVLNRTVLQSMPAEWQLRFVRCLNQLGEATAELEQAPDFNVEPGEWVGGYYCTEGDEGSSCHECPDGCDGDDDSPCDEACGDGCAEWGYAFVEGGDPVPHYQRGRTRVPLLPYMEDSDG